MNGRLFFLVLFLTAASFASGEVSWFAVTDNSKLVHKAAVGKQPADFLFNNAYPNIKRILEAEKEYFAKNGKYTPKLSDLNLSFEDVRVQHFMNNTTRIYLKNGFYYVLTDSLIAVYSNCSTTTESYYLDFGFNGKSYCVAKARAADASCKALGGINPTPNNRIPSWVAYELPKGFPGKR